MPPTLKSGFPRYGWPLLFAIFLDLIGFGMVIPDVQTRLEGFGARGWLIGVVLAAYFLVQFVVSPLWGRYSDRVGRKPVLLLCAGLSALSMLAYAFAGSIATILLSRVLAGFAAANVVVAQAYFADATTPEARPLAMGRVGAATTAGLILGPALGGLLAAAGGNRLLGLAAASTAALGLLWIATGVPGIAPQGERPPDRRFRLVDLSLFGAAPSLRFLFVLSAVAYFALACLEGTFGRLIKHNLGYGPEQFGFLFGYEALLSVLVQTLLLSWVSARMPSRGLLCAAFALEGIGLTFTPYAPNLAGLFVASTFFAVGASFANPTLNSLCSTATPPEREGEMFGLLQSARSFGFLAGPILGGVLFDWRPDSPYLLAGVALFAAGVLAAQYKIRPR